MSKNLDELLDQLKTDGSLPEPDQIKRSEPDINDDNVNEWILKKAGQLVENGMDAVEALKQVILSSGDPGEVSAYSEMFRSVVGALDTITKINVQNKKSKTAKELKEMDIEAKKQLPERPKGDTNILIATREEIIKNFLDKGKEVIDAEYSEEEDEGEETN